MYPHASPFPFVVLVGLDFSPLSAAALAAARTFTERLPAAQLYALHIVSPPPEGHTRTRADAADEAMHHLQNFLLSHEVPRVVRPVVIVGEASTTFPTAARVLRADLVVVGTRAQLGGPAGKVADALLERAPCSVYLVRPSEARLQECNGPARSQGAPVSDPRLARSDLARRDSTPSLCPA